MLPPTETIFVTRLPHDVLQAELQRLFDDMPGFLGARVATNRAKSGCNGFVTFDSVADAEAAMMEKRGIEFPRGTELVLDYSSKPRGGGGGGGERMDVRDVRDVRRDAAYDPRDRRHEMEERRDYRAEAVRDHRAEAPTEERRKRERNDTTRARSPPRRAAQEPARDYGFDTMNMGPYERPFLAWAEQPGNFKPGDVNLPSRLFVDGIPNDCAKREIMHVFRPFHTFAHVSLFPAKKGPPRQQAFVEFDSMVIAKFCMNKLNGYLFDEGDERGIKVEMAKSKR